LAVTCHQRLSSSPYRRAQGARWAGLTAPGCALCGRKSLPRRTRGSGMAQARPQGAPGAPLGAPWDITGAPLDITGAPGEVQRRTLARPGPTPAGHGRTPKAHLELRWVYYSFASLSGLQSRHGLHTDAELLLQRVGMGSIGMWGGERAAEGCLRHTAGRASQLCLLVCLWLLPWLSSQFRLRPPCWVVFFAVLALARSGRFAAPVTAVGSRG
jgi:hypothetical protein